MWKFQKRRLIAPEPVYLDNMGLKQENLTGVLKNSSDIYLGCWLETSVMESAALKCSVSCRLNLQILHQICAVHNVFWACDNLSCLGIRTNILGDGYTDKGVYGILSSNAIIKLRQKGIFIFWLLPDIDQILGNTVKESSF